MSYHSDASFSFVSIKATVVSLTFHFDLTSGSLLGGTFCELAQQPANASLWRCQL